MLLKRQWKSLQCLYLSCYKVSHEFSGRSYVFAKKVTASKMLMFLAFKQSAFFQFVQQIQKAIPA